MTPADPALTILAAVLTLGGMLAIVGLVLRKFFKETKLAPPAPAPTPTVKAVVQAAAAPSDEHVRCCCGEPATEPAPILQRGRGSVVRDLLGMPPRYRRVVVAGPAVYCRPHAHSADAAMAAWLSKQRAEVSKAYALMADAAAVFETEGLPRAVQESLTDGQRKAGRRALAAPLVNGATVAIPSEASASN